MTLRRPFYGLLLAVGIMLLLIVSEVSGKTLGIAALNTMSPHLQFALLTAGIILIVFGLGGAENCNPEFRPSPTHHLQEQPTSEKVPPHFTAFMDRDLGRGKVALIVTLLFLLALLIRLWHIGDSIRVLVDEIHFVYGLTRFWTEEQIGILTPLNNLSPFTWLYPYWQVTIVDIFGRDLASARAASAIIGALNIPALYLLARTLFDKRTALLAAFILATFPPHIHYSRIALLSITDPLMGTLAFAFLARGLSHGNRRDWAAGGAFLGLTQYFYEGGRLIYIPLAALWIILALLATRFLKHSTSLTENANQIPLPQGEGQRVRVGGLVTALIALLLVAAPVYYAIFAGGDALAGRMDASGLNPDYWRGLLLSSQNLAAHFTDHIFPAFLFYVALPDATVYYGGGTPLVLLPLAPFFLLGVWFALRRLAAPGMLLTLLWLTVTALGNSLLVISHASTRYVVVFPAIALMIALGLRYAPSRHLTIRKMRLSWAYIAALIFAFVQLGYYFGPHLARFDADFRDFRADLDLDDAVNRSRNLPPGTQVHIISRTTFDPGYAGKLLRFYTDDITADGYMSGDLTVHELHLLSTEVNHAFFIDPLDVTTLTALQNRYGNRLQGPLFSPYNIAPDKAYVLFYVPLHVNPTT